MLYKFLTTVIVSFLVFFAVPSTVEAVCPVCTVAVVGGLGLSRFLGIDDAISGVWVGGLILSLSFWTASWITNKKWLSKVKFEFLVLLTSITLGLVTFLPMYATKFIGHPSNTILGIDKLVFGSFVGTISFLVGYWVDKKVRQIEGKQLFIYQKVVFPLSSLLITSAILYLLVK